VFENNVLRKIFEPKKGDVTVKWRRLHNEEHNDLYFSPNIVWVIKSRRAGYVECNGRGEVCTGLWWVNLMERDHYEDPVADGPSGSKCGEFLD
jgi:hypothetical protein